MIYLLDSVMLIDHFNGIEKLPRNGAMSGVCPLRGVYRLLDSRLRGNDGANGLFGLMLHTQNLIYAVRCQHTQQASIQGFLVCSIKLEHKISVIPIRKFHPNKFLNRFSDAA